MSFSKKKNERIYLVECHKIKISHYPFSRVPKKRQEREKMDALDENNFTPTIFMLGKTAISFIGACIIFSGLHFFRTCTSPGT